MGNHVGFLGGICALTDVPGILRWDCVATDWFHAPAYPTYLYYNPHDAAKTVTVSLEKSADLYDLVAGRSIAKSVRADYKMALAPDQVVVLVHVPTEGKVRRQGGRMMVNDVPVDYRVRGDARLRNPEAGL
jgi:hypothetical protein